MARKHFSFVNGTYPLYCREMPIPQTLGSFASDAYHIDLSNEEVHLPPYGELNTVDEAVRLFDARAAAAVSAATGFGAVRVFPEGSPETELLEEKDYGDKAPKIYIPKAKCLAALAYPDFFPEDHADDLRPKVSEAILAATQGWCGTFGPGVDSWWDVAGKHLDGDYDMSQMHLLQIAYCYYDELSPEAREHLITHLLALGRIHRPNLDDTLTHGPMPNDWARAGYVVPPLVGEQRIGETENHILMIATARYLTNQLLYQRDHNPVHDNRRNGSEDAPDCTEFLLMLLRNILQDDFSEYNAKPYQTYTRSALLNLCSYAYDHDVRLAARMVLDYISAHIAVSSNDLRRMVPFRRRNEEDKFRNAQLPGGVGFMDVGLLEWFLGADPMAEPFAIQAGNTRAYETGNARHVPPDNINEARPWTWAIASGGGDATMEALSDYRLPPSIHEFFVNDAHRRFFQRLHRVVQPDVELTGRNCDNYEIYAGSPSYLITAGGKPATYAVDPHFAAVVAPTEQAKQLGVAVTTSFMPTTQPSGLCGNPSSAGDLIQFSSFSSTTGEVANYGVAPDFACGHQVHLPNWCAPLVPYPPKPVFQTSVVLEPRCKFYFVNKGGAKGLPGFYLALLRDGDFTVMEAHDTWLYPELTFEQFKSNVWNRNQHLSASGLSSNVEAQYTTQNGNRLHFVIWKEGDRELDAKHGARILSIEYGKGDDMDTRMGTLVDAGNDIDPFLSGTIMNSTGDGRIVISNPFLGTNITLDMRDPLHPKRTSETGEVEEAGSNHEVWVDFGWKGPNVGDFFQPFNTIAAAAAAVADGGVIKLMPGSTSERPSIQNNKRMRLVAPIGNVTIGAR